MKIKKKKCADDKVGAKSDGSHQSAGQPIPVFGERSVSLSCVYYYLDLQGHLARSKPISLPVLMEAIEGLPVASERDSSRRLMAGPLATPSHSPGSEETGPR